jgi:hypothetical protein
MSEKVKKLMWHIKPLSMRETTDYIDNRMVTTKELWLFNVILLYWSQKSKD